MKVRITLWRTLTIICVLILSHATVYEYAHDSRPQQVKNCTVNQSFASQPPQYNNWTRLESGFYRINSDCYLQINEVEGPGIFIEGYYFEGSGNAEGYNQPNTLKIR